MSIYCLKLFISYKTRIRRSQVKCQFLSTLVSLKFDRQKVQRMEGKVYITVRMLSKVTPIKLELTRGYNGEVMKETLAQGLHCKQYYILEADHPPQRVTMPPISVHFIQSFCDRCDEDLSGGRAMSFFMNETICLNCLQKEGETRAKIREILGADADLEYQGCGFIPSTSERGK